MADGDVVMYCLRPRTSEADTVSSGWVLSQQYEKRNDLVPVGLHSQMPPSCWAVPETDSPQSPSSHLQTPNSMAGCPKQETEQGKHEEVESSRLLGKSDSADTQLCRTGAACLQSRKVEVLTAS